MKPERLLPVIGGFVFWSLMGFFIILLIASCAAPPDPGEPGWSKYEEVQTKRKTCIAYFVRLEQTEPGRYEVRPGGFSVREYCARKYK